MLGETIRYALVERFCRVLASMVSAGVPLPEALAVATEALRNLVFIRGCAEVGAAMLEGEGLAGPLAAPGCSPASPPRCSGSARRPARSTPSSTVAAAYYEGELDYKIKKLTALFEPIVIIVMGGIVGFVAVALVSAMYGIFRAANLQ